MDNFRRLMEEEGHQRNGIAIDFFTTYPRLTPLHAKLSPTTAATVANPSHSQEVSTGTGATSKEMQRGSDKESYRATTPNTPKDLIESPHYLEFEGKYWYLILKYRSNALRTAFVADTAEALSLPPSCVTNLHFAQTQLVAHFSVRHSAALSASQVKRLLDAHDYARVWKIYQAVLNLFDDQFSGDVQNIEHGDLEALVQRVYVGEADALGHVQQAPTSPSRAARSERLAKGSHSAALPPALNKDVLSVERSESVVKKPCNNAAATERCVQSPQYEHAPRRGNSQSDWLQMVPWEDSIGFEGDYRESLQLRRGPIEAAVARDVARAVAGVENVAIRDVVAQEKRLTVSFAITWSSAMEPRQIHEALLDYAFPETWRVLLGTPSVVKAPRTPTGGLPNTVSETVPSPRTTNSPRGMIAPSSATAASLVVHDRVVSPAHNTRAGDGASTSRSAFLGPRAGATEPPINVVKTTHCIRVAGDDWTTVIDEQLSALRTACTEDAVAATAAFEDCVIVVKALDVDAQGTLLIHLSAQHPLHIGTESIDAALAAHTLRAVWAVYDSVHAAESSGGRNIPTGWVVTGHTTHLDGSAWASILEISSAAVRTAFVADVSEALGLPESSIAVDRTAFEGFLAVHYTVQRPAHISTSMVTRGVAAAPMTRVWKVYAQHLKTAGIAVKSTTSSLFTDTPATQTSGVASPRIEPVSRRPSRVEEGRRRSSASTRASLVSRGETVLTTHIIVVDGDKWDAVVQAYPESVKDAVRNDFCRANSSDLSAVPRVTLHIIPSGLRAAVDFEHSPTVSVQLITERLERCEMNSLWDLHDDVVSKLATSAHGTHATSDGGSGGVPSSRVLTNHALMLDEPLLFTRPASLTTALKKDLNPLLEPIGAHVVEVTLEEADDGVTIFYSVSHGAATPSTEIDRIADSAEMQHTWDLADELAAQAEAQHTMPPVTHVERTVCADGEASTRRSSTQSATSTTGITVPASSAQLAIPSPQKRSRHGSLTAERGSEAPHRVASSVTFRTLPAASPVESPTHPKLRRLFAAEEEVASQISDMSRLTMTNLGASDGDSMEKSHATETTPLSHKPSTLSRRPSHGSLAPRRSSATAENIRTSRRPSQNSVEHIAGDSITANESAVDLSAFSVYFEGTGWARVLALYSNDFVDRFATDVSSALGISKHDVLNVGGEYADGLLAHYELLCPGDVAHQVNERVDASPMSLTWALYEQVAATTSEPHDTAARSSVSSYNERRRLSHSAVAPSSHRNSLVGDGPQAIVTRHAIYFDGTMWARLLDEQENKVRLALVHDVSEAVQLPPSSMMHLDVEYADGLLAEYELRHTSELTVDEVNTLVDTSSMPRTWELYNTCLGVNVSPSPLKRLVATSEELPGLRACAEELPRLRACAEELPRLRACAEELPRLRACAEELPRLRACAEELPRLRACAEELPRLRACAEELPRLRATEVETAAAPPLLPPKPSSTRTDTAEMPHPPRRFMESGRNERPFRARSTEPVEVRRYHSDEAPTPNDLRPLEALEFDEEGDGNSESGLPSRRTSRPATQSSLQHSDHPECEKSDDTEDDVDVSRSFSEEFGVVEFAMEFDGDRWEELLDNHAPTLMDAFMGDVVEALGVAPTVIRGVDLFAVDGLTVNYILKLPRNLDEAEVNHRTDDFEFPRTWQLYDQFSGDNSVPRVTSVRSVDQHQHQQQVLDEQWTDFVRIFEATEWNAVVPRYLDEVRELFTVETAELVGIDPGKLKVVHMPVEHHALYIHFRLTLPDTLDEVTACEWIESFPYPRLMHLYDSYVSLAQRNALPVIPPPSQEDKVSVHCADVRSSAAASTVTHDDVDVEERPTSGSPFGTRDPTVGPPPPLTVSTIAPAFAPPTGSASAVDPNGDDETETSVHTVYVEGFWNPIAVHHKAELKRAFTNDVVHAVGIPERLVTQVEPLAFRQGLLVTYVILHDTEEDVGNVDDLLDADPLDNMWELYRQHEPDASDSSPRHTSFSSGQLTHSPRARRHSSVTEELFINPLIVDDIADRYYSMLFEGAYWPQVLQHERSHVRSCFVEDCANALRTNTALSPKTVQSVQVITEIPLHEGMLVHYVVDNASSDQREAIDDLVTQYAFPLTWAVFDAYMQHTSASPRNSTWVAARRSRSRATSYAFSPNAERLFTIVAYADEPPATAPGTLGNVSANTRTPSQSDASSPRRNVQSSHGPSSRPATAHRSLTSFRLQRGKRASLVSRESFDSLHDGDEAEATPVSTATQHAPNEMHTSTVAPSEKSVPEQVWNSAADKNAERQSMQNFTFPVGSPISSPRERAGEASPKRAAPSADQARDSRAPASATGSSRRSFFTTDGDIAPLYSNDAGQNRPEPLSAANESRHHGSAHVSRAPSVHGKHGLQTEPAGGNAVSRVPPCPQSSDYSSDANSDAQTPPEEPEAGWLYAFEFELEKPLPHPGVVDEPIQWVASPVNFDQDEEQAHSEDSVIELPVQPSEWMPLSVPEQPPPSGSPHFFQPPPRPAQQRRIVVLDRAAPPPPDTPLPLGSLPMHNDGNVIVVIQRTVLDVDGLLDKLGQLEDLVRNRYDTLRDMFETI